MAGIPIDGSTVDIATLLVGVACIFLKPAKRLVLKRRPCFDSRDCTIDFLNGAALVPFIVLVGSVVSSKILAEALQFARFPMAGAGVMGLIFVIRELIAG